MSGNRGGGTRDGLGGGPALEPRLPCGGLPVRAGEQGSRRVERRGMRIMSHQEPVGNLSNGGLVSIQSPEVNWQH